MTQIEQRIAHLSAEKVALLARKLQMRRGRPASVQQITPVDERSEYPLAFVQQRLWFVDRLEPDSPLYNIPIALHLQGPLDYKALRDSLTTLVARHSILRASFVEHAGVPTQRIAPAGTVALPLVDLSALPEHDRKDRVAQEQASAARQPFDLASGPLVRSRLLQLATDEHLLFLTLHHIVADGWSIEILARELSTCYNALTGANLPDLPELPIQYTDYAVWQREQLDGAQLEQRLEYWLSELADCPPVLNFPYDRPRPAQATIDGAEHSFAIPDELYVALQELARQEQTTLFTVLLTAFQILLYRYSGQADFCIGTPVANRTQNECSGLVGFFANTVPIRATLDAHASLREQLRRVHAANQAAVAHQDVPFEVLVERLQPDRDPRISPLFQVMFALDGDALQSLQLRDIAASRVDHDNRTAKFELVLTAEERDGRLFGRFEYRTALFDAATITRLARHYHNVLRAVVADPGYTIIDLPLLSTEDVQTLLADWNDTQVKRPVAACVHELVEAQVERTPDATAVLSETAALSYAELNEQANRLAHLLREQPVKPGILVGVSMDRSVELIVALLAVLKAGGAYVPLDPHYPGERLAWLLHDAQPALLLCADAAQQHQLAAKLGPDVELPPLLNLAALSEKLERMPANNPATSGDDRQLAYVIYTSGSTGTPKGVAVPHRAVVNHNLAVADLFAISAGDRMLQFNTISFDAAIEEIFPTLQQGATLVLRPAGPAPTGSELLAFVEHYSVTLLDLPTAYWHNLVREMRVTQTRLPQSVRMVIVGGEAAAAPLLNDWWQLVEPTQRWANTYGPTETTVIATAYLPAHATAFAAAEPVPIGRPIANMRLYVLDERQQPVAPGAIGELYIGGTGVARGYLNQPEQTAARFLRDPFVADPAARMYRSGDLVRYLPDGNLVFLGRVDAQVKIRGFRIEPGEIEAVLISHAAVHACTVQVRDDERGSQYLAAYLVAEAGMSGAELREYARSQLPEYMLPAAYVLLDALPLTATGKMAHRQLPAPTERDFPRNAGFVAPRTPIEQLIADIWTQILGLQQIGINDNFFELGGHSLLATQVVARIRETLQREIAVRDIFTAPTVAQLAQRIAEFRAVEGAVPLLQPVPREQHMPVAYAQQRLWFLSQIDPDSPLYNIAAALRLRGNLAVNALQTAFQLLVDRHESLRTTFTTVDGIVVQVIAPRQEIELEIVDLQSATEVDYEHAVAERARQHFDLERGPLLRVSLLQRGDAEHVLVLVCHHTIADGWSTGLMVREIGATYAALRTGQAAPLAMPAIQYADFAVWQRTWLQGETRERLLEYWRRKLAGAAPLLGLPTDRPRPNAQSFYGARFDFTIDAELSAALYRLSRAAGTTLFMTLLAAFKVLLYRYSNQADISIGTPIANRSHSALEGVIGCFVNTLVLRSDLSGAARFSDLLQQVRETTLEAYAHQDLPFEMLVDELQPERDIAFSPLFQVMFVLQNTPAIGLDLPDLAVTTLPIDSAVSAFDLTLQIEETAGSCAASFDYNQDLFDAATIERMAGHYRQVLQTIVTDHTQQVDRLPVLPEHEERRLLVEWNSTAEPYPFDHCVHELFAEQAARTPERNALVYEDTTLSYAELNVRANQLAHQLIKCGIGPEQIVAIFLDRSIEMVVAVLAVLKAGGAYMPLDPAHPRERLHYLVADAEPAVLITNAGLWTARLAGTTTVPQLLLVDHEAAQIARRPSSEPPVSVTPANLAYVIYTSGSTGKPKGTLVEHRGLSNLAVVLLQEFNMNPTCRVLQFAALGFDAAVTEICMALLAGATLHLAAQETLRSPSELIDLLQRQRITTVTLPPSLLAVLPDADLPDLQMVASAGERCPVEVAARWAKGRRFLNGYGPTEATVAATYYHVQELDASAVTVPIGRPIANTRLYVLDAQRQPVPIGVPGELYIGGVGVARGYLNRPDLTAERFLTDPFVTEPGARMYKTGDLVRYRADGVLEYIGRSDDQVKIRGFRIELGEIAAALSAHPAVQDCVVVAHEDRMTRRLVGYYVAARDAAVSAGELRDYLRVTLPDYMVPATLMKLERLPLTSNGKVDRKALPAPVFAQGNEGNQYIAPRTEREAALAAVWAQVLGLEQVGVHANFFDLGGDSIMSIQIVSRALQSGLHITPRLLFEFPTVAELAERAATATTATAEQGLLSGQLPLTPVQRWFFAQSLAVPNHWNQAVLLEPRESLDLDLLAAAFAYLVEHHDALRLRFTLTETGWQQEYAAAGEQVQIARYDLTTCAEPAAQAAILAQAAELHTALDIACGPLFKLAYFNRGPAHPGRLLAIIHHLAIDGVSWRILLEDLEQTYRRLAAGATPQLPPKSSSYRQWAERLLTYADAPEVHGDSSYWLGLPERLPGSLPRDMAAGANIEAAAALLTSEIDATETRLLLEEAAGAYGSDVNDLLLTGLIATLSEWSSTTQLVIDLEGHGRADLFSDLDISRTVGWFTSVYPVRFDTRDGREPAALLKRTKELLRAVPRQGLSYGLLRYLSADAALQAELSARASAEVSYNYLGQFRQVAAEGALFRATAEPSGPAHAGIEQRSHVLEFTAYVVNGRLRIDWIYCRNLHRESTIAGLAERFLIHLRALIDHCRSPAATGYTPADFPDVALSQDAIDALLDEIEVGGDT